MSTVKLQRHWSSDSLSLCVPAALFSYSLNLPITWTFNQNGKKNLSLSPPALHSVARATAAILPCPIGLGYTSQAGHKCGMTVRERKQGEWDRERDGDKDRAEGETEGWEEGGQWPRHKDFEIFSPDYMNKSRAGHLCTIKILPTTNLFFSD